MANYISEQDLKRYMNDKESFHAALSGNDYDMPGLRKSSFVTCDLMYDIYHERVYFPKVQNVQIRNCLHPPNAKQLVEIICGFFEGYNYNSEQEMKQCKRLVKHLMRNKPDQEWLLRLLATIKADHPVFQPGYRPPPTRPEVEAEAKMHMIPKREGFFLSLIHI